MEKIEPNLRETVLYLSGEIGERSHGDLEKLSRSAAYIEQRFLSIGCRTERQEFTYRENTYCNIITSVAGVSPDSDGILVVGAHYDTVEGTPGADDNASGIAGLLELARLASKDPFARTVRFVAFTLEEPPTFMTRSMGSYECAKRLREEGVAVSGMISLEMLGYFRDEEASQLYPSSFIRPFFPERGNFISFVGNLSSRKFTRKVKKAFMAASTFPVESLNAPSVIPGVDFSDHRNFWKFGYPAFMVTDTAFYRNPNYHAAGDTADTLDYGKMAAVIAGLYQALRDI